MRLVSLFAGAWLLSSVGPAAAQTDVRRVGVVIDGPWERNLEVERVFQRELVELLTPKTDAQPTSRERLGP